MSITTDLSLEWILSAIGFIVAFIIGLWQYRRAQRQEKVALLLPLIKEFETDEELQAACHLFDYDAGTFSLRGEEHRWKNADLLEALKVVEWDQDWPPLQEAMREVLDRFFDFIQKLSSFIDVGLLNFKDLKYFYYYFELLTGIERYKGPGFGNALNRYLDAYRFSGCRKCCDLYRKLPQSQRVELQLSAQVPPSGQGGAKEEAGW
jgi:hypothetical protein